MTESRSAAPTVTCIVATNRVSRFLDEALSSAADQSHAPLEILVVDDGSPEPERLDAATSAINGARVIHRRHEGVAAARNAGAAQATGEWIAFLDDDDRWAPSRLERQLADLVEVPDAVVGYCGMRTIDTDGQAIMAGEHVQVRGRADVLRRRTGVLAGNTLIRRSAFNAVGGFDESLRFAEDLDLVIRLSSHGSFVMTPADLLDYRLHAGNSTGRYRDLVRGIDVVLRRHADAAQRDGDAEAGRALRDSRAANGRYAWWSASRAMRARGVMRHPIAAVGDIAWCVRFAPLAPGEALLRRLRPRSA